MPGPPPTPLPLRLLRGNPGKRPLRAEPQPTLSERVPEPPDFLSGYAADEWRRMAPELHRLGPLTVLDTAALAAYCMAYQHWRVAGEMLCDSAEGDQHQRPLLRIAANAARDMVKFASEFGMTPAARSRVAAVSGGPQGKFGGLIG
jgi:P27 family predicted phage terminase small subunit